ncbi:MAG: PspC domain-containing protein [Gemmatimonadales bacterium]
MGTQLQKPLRRSSTNKIVLGVCGGFADWLGWDPTLVRVLYVAASLMSAAFPGLIVYFVLGFVIPEDTSY